MHGPCQRCTASAPACARACGAGAPRHPRPYPAPPPSPLSPSPHPHLSPSPPAEPWLHLGLGLVGAYAGFRLANIYDDTTDTLNRQLSAYAALPSWAHSQLSSDDLNAELREKRKAQLREKVQALAAIEEAEFKAKLQGMGAEELQEARARGAVRLMA